MLKPLVDQVSFVTVGAFENDLFETGLGLKGNNEEDVLVGPLDKI